MTDAKATSSRQSPLETLLQVLREGKDAAMRLRKASAQKEFMIARRLLFESYAEFAPEDLPVDMERVRKDFEIRRDQMIDEACDEVYKAYRVAVGVLKLVAERSPVFYEESAQAAGVDVRKWRNKPMPRVAAPRIGRALPSMVLMHLTSTSMQEIVDMILGDKQGVTFYRLCEQLGLNAKASSRLAAKKFVQFLKKGGHVTSQGTGKGQRYLASDTLRRLRSQLIVKSEAAPE